MIAIIIFILVVLICMILRKRRKIAKSSNNLNLSKEINSNKDQFERVQSMSPVGNNQNLDDDDNFPNEGNLEMINTNTGTGTTKFKQFEEQDENFGKMLKDTNVVGDIMLDDIVEDNYEMRFQISNNVLFKNFMRQVINIYLDEG